MDHGEILVQFRPKNPWIAPRKLDEESKMGKDKTREISMANKTLPLRLTLNTALTSRAGKLFRKRGRFTRPAAASEL